MREAGQNFQTLQRQQRTVDAKPAEMLKAQYREKATGRDWIEELVFIEGPDNEIYSVALKCAAAIMRSGWSRCCTKCCEAGRCRSRAAGRR